MGTNRTLRWVCLLGWLVPGLGHFITGKRAKGAVFFAVILSLALSGWVMGGTGGYVKTDSFLKDRDFYAVVCLGSRFGNGLFTVAVVSVERARGSAWARDRLMARYNEIGSLYMAI